MPAGVSAQDDNGGNGTPTQQAPNGFGPNAGHGPRQGQDGQRGGNMMKGGERGRMGSSTRPGMSGAFGSSTRPMMGKPAIVGKVTAVSGTTLTVDSFRRSATSSATTTFMVDASKAIVKKANATSTVSAITTGDLVLVQGTITGTSIAASLVIDGVRPAQNTPRGDMKSVEAPMGSSANDKVGFFGGIKNFFGKLFGF